MRRFNIVPICSMSPVIVVRSSCMAVCGGCGCIWCVCGVGVVGQ
jgi:hypothetical protein